MQGGIAERAELGCSLLVCGRKLVGVGALSPLRRRQVSAFLLIDPLFQSAHSLARLQTTPLMKLVSRTCCQRVPAATCCWERCRRWLPHHACQGQFPSHRELSGRFDHCLSSTSTSRGAGCRGLTRRVSARFSRDQLRTASVRVRRLAGSFLLSFATSRPG